MRARHRAAEEVLVTRVTVTIHWWVIPPIIVVLALWGATLPKGHGDFDMVTPLLRLAIVVGGLLLAGGILVGKLVF